MSLELQARRALTTLLLFCACGGDGDDAGVSSTGGSGGASGGAGAVAGGSATANGGAAPGGQPQSTDGGDGIGAMGGGDVGVAGAGGKSSTGGEPSSPQAGATGPGGGSGPDAGGDGAGGDAMFGGAGALNGGDAGATALGGNSSGGTVDPTTGGGTATGGTAPGGGGGVPTSGGAATMGGASSGGVSATGGASGTGGSSGSIYLAEQVDAGNFHTCVVLTDGRTRCWGNNGYGQLGDGTTATRTSPVTVGSLANARGVSGGGFFNCAITENESVACFGFNAQGQLGNGTKTNSATPIVISALDSVASLSVGASHTCAVRRDNSLYCWGDNTGYKLGTNSKADPTKPAPVAVSATAVAVGENHTCAVQTSGEVRCWGNSDFSQLGPSPGLNGVVGIASGYMHSCALLSDGTVKCWGNGTGGQLGDGNFSVPLAPVTVTDLHDVSALTAGFGHTCALRTDGTAACWGSNSFGQLGDGTTQTRTTPVSVEGLTSIRAISAGFAHTCALLADHSVHCWGLNEFGQLGLGTVTSSTTPALVQGLEQIGTGGSGGAGSGGASGGSSGASGGSSSADGGSGGFGGAAQAEPELLPPRLLAPISANYQGPRPRLRWALTAPATAARVLVCRDRECARPVSSWIGVSNATPDFDLAPGTYFWRAFGRRQEQNGEWREGTLSSSTWEFVVDHSSVSKLVGYGSSPDHDGNGRADLVITNGSETGADTFQTASASVFASVTGGVSRRQKIYCDIIVNGSVDNWQFASLWRNAGDVNGDGYPDAVTVTGGRVGAPRIRLYRGGPNGLSGSAANDITLGSSKSDGISALEAPGDVDGDGYADVVLLFNPYANSNYTTQLLLMRGGPLGLSAPEVVLDTGRPLPVATLRALGDMNGDGFPEVAVASGSFDDPWVSIFLGSAGGLSATPANTFNGVFRVWPLGDVNADGYADATVEKWVKRPSLTAVPDTAYLILGGSALSIDAQHTLEYPKYPPRVTECRSCTFNLDSRFYPAGDVNGDGYGDVMLAGSFQQDPWSRVYVYYGSAAGLSPQNMREMYSPEDLLRSTPTNFGWSVAGVGDFDGDSFDDIAIGAADNGAPGVSGRIQPKVRVYRGSSLGPSVDQTWSLQSTQSTALNDSFGTIISGLSR